MARFAGLTQVGKSADYMLLIASPADLPTNYSQLLFERSEFLIDTSPPQNPSVRVCVRLIMVLVWGTYYSSEASF